MKKQSTLFFLLILVMSLSSVFDAKAQNTPSDFYSYTSLGDNLIGKKLSLSDGFKAQLNKASGGSYTYNNITWKTGDPLPNPSMPGSIITDMSGLFANCDLATSLDLSYFNTSTVTHMNSMFLGCISLTSLNINNFNTANVIDMGNMFSGVSSITTLNLDNFNTSKVTDMESMFCGCNSLESLDLSKFNTSLVTDMSSMFDSAEKLSFLYLSNFDASSLITANRMFHMCSKITYLDLSNFNIINPTHSVDVENMYLGCSRFVSGARAVGFAIDDANAELFNDPAKTNIDTAKLLFQTKDAQTAFYIYKYDNGAYKLELTPAFKEQLNKASGGMLVDGDYTWRTGNPLPNPCPHGFFNNKVVSDMSLLFADCSSATSIDLSLFTPMYVKNTSGMFMNCSSLTSLDLMSFDAISIENISRMFYNCGAATNGTPAVGYAQSEEQATIFNNPQFTSIDTNKLRFVEGLDLSKFYVYSEVAEGYRVLLTSEFSEQLNKASGGVYTVGRYTWRTGDPLPNPAPNGKYRGIAVASFGSLFYGLSAVKTLDLSLFNTSNVQYMIAMFGECSSLTSLNLSSFNTSKVVNLGQMFNGCSSLTELDLSNFDISNETYLGTMFLNCGKATNGVPAIGYAKDAATAALFNDFSKTQIDLTKIRFRNASAPDFYTYGYSNTGSGLYVAMSTEFRAEVNKASGGYYQYGDIIWQTGDPLPNPAPDGMYEGQPVTDMMSLFSECSAATSLDLSLFNTTNVVNMSFMFNNCSSLTELDLTSFQTPKLTMLERMFYNCSAITMLDLSSFDLLSPVLTRSNERVLYMNEMLLDCGSSSGGSSYTAYAKDQAHIDLFSNSTLTKLDDTKLRFEVSTGIENVDNSDVKVYSQGGTIYLDGLDGQAVAIYSATGMLVYQAVVTSESLSVQLPRGIYLVKIGASIFKIAM